MGHSRGAFAVALLLSIGLMRSTTAADQSPPTADVTVEISSSSDKTELFLVFRETQQAYYFNNNSTRLCYTFSIPGSWKPAGTAAFQSTDGKGFAGALLYSPQQLAPHNGKDPVSRAAALITGVYSQNLEAQPAEMTLEPMESAHAGTMKWTARWPAPTKLGPKIGVSASKIFVPLPLGWVAQLTIQLTPDDAAVTEALLATLSTTREPGCYKSFIAKQFPQALEYVR